MVPSNVANMQEDFKSHFPVLSSKRAFLVFQPRESRVFTAQDGICGMKNKDVLFLYCIRNAHCREFLSLGNFVLLQSFSSLEEARYSRKAKWRPGLGSGEIRQDAVLRHR